MRTLHQAEPCARPDCRHMRYQLAESVPMVEWEAWRDVAIALVSEIAVCENWGCAPNERYAEALR